MRRHATFLWLLASLLLAAPACNSDLGLATPAATTAPATAPAAASHDDDHDLRASVSYLASDELEGRGVTTEGINKAADYIAATFRSLGLTPLPGEDDYFQTFPMTTGAELGAKTHLAVGNETLVLRADYTPTSFSAEGTFAGPVVFAGYGIASQEHGYDDFAGVDVKGKVALVLRSEAHDAQGDNRSSTHGWSRSAHLSSKATAAAERGAVALLLVNPPTHHPGDPLMPFARRFVGETSSIPVFQVTQAVAERLLTDGGLPPLAELQKQIDASGQPASRALAGSVTVSGEVSLERSERQVKNVVALLPGKGPLADEFIVVGAHYDHVGRGETGTRSPTTQIHNGADDNASGTAAVLEIAEHLAKGDRTGRSIVFAAFTAEEWGLVGSMQFVKNPPVPLENVAAMINFDMVGRLRDNRVLVGGTGTASEFKPMLERIDQHFPIDLKEMSASGFAPSDHSSFAMKQIPVLFFFTGLHEDYHRPSDDAEKINYQGLGAIADVGTAIVRELATLPRPQYVAGAVATTMPAAGAGRGSGVMLGVVPDYASVEPGEGVRISGTVPGSPAAAAGLRDGDVIVQFGGKSISSIYDLTDALADASAGQRVEITVVRDGQKKRIEATLAERKAAGD